MVVVVVEGGAGGGDSHLMTAPQYPLQGKQRWSGARTGRTTGAGGGGRGGGGGGAGITLQDQGDVGTDRAIPGSFCPLQVWGGQVSPTHLPIAETLSA